MMDDSRKLWKHANKNNFPSSWRPRKGILWRSFNNLMDLIIIWFETALPMKKKSYRSCLLAAIDDAKGKITKAVLH